MIIRDRDLATEEQVLERLRSIWRQREALCEPRKRPEHYTTFHKRQEKIAKLTEREDALRRKLKALRHANTDPNNLV